MIPVIDAFTLMCASISGSTAALSAGYGVTYVGGSQPQFDPVQVPHLVISVVDSANFNLIEDTCAFQVDLVLEADSSKTDEENYVVAYNYTYQFVRNLKYMGKTGGMLIGERYSYDGGSVELLSENYDKRYILSRFRVETGLNPS